MLWLMSPHLNRVVLVSFTHFLYSGFYSLFSFGLKILLTLTLGSRKHFLPKSLVFQTMALSLRRIVVTLRCSLELLCSLLLQFSLPSSTTTDDYIQMSFIPSSPIALTLREAMNFLIGDSSIISCLGFREFFELLIDLSESPLTYCFWPFSPACVRVKSICLAAFIKFLCEFPLILSILLLYECTQSSADTLELSSGANVLPDRAGSQQINCGGCPSKSIQLTCIWPEHLIMIHQSRNLNSFGS